MTCLNTEQSNHYEKKTDLPSFQSHTQKWLHVKRKARKAIALLLGLLVRGQVDPSCSITEPYPSAYYLTC